MNGTLLLNGVEVNIGDIKTTEFTVPKEYKDITPTRHDYNSGSIEIKIKPNPLWKHQQETGFPKMVHLSFLCNL